MGAIATLWKLLSPEVFGYSIVKTKSFLANCGTGGWYPLIKESFPGAWQQNIEVSKESLLAHHAVYACIRLISSDVGKLRLRLMQQDSATNVWGEVENPAWSVFLRQPNRYQSRKKFFEWWITSKLVHGNVYAMKARDTRGVVRELYILDPSKVRPLIAPDGSVFYHVSADNLSQLDESQVLPAREIIHDVMVAMFHPLCGTSPLMAAALSAGRLGWLA